MTTKSKVYIGMPDDLAEIFYNFSESTKPKITFSVHNSYAHDVSILEIKTSHNYSTIVEDFRNYINSLLRNIKEESEYSIPVSREEVIRQQAIAKLTSEEVQILGLDENESEDDEENE